MTSDSFERSCFNNQSGECRDLAYHIEASVNLIISNDAIRDYPYGKFNSYLRNLEKTGNNNT